MSDAQIAILISGISLAISISGFVWSIWKEFIYVKAKLDISFSIMQIFQQGQKPMSILSLSATNMGPNPVILHTCSLREYRGPFRKDQVGILNPIQGPPHVLPHDTRGPFSDGLPFELGVGKMKSFHFPYQRDCCLAGPITRIGIRDTFGRNHFARRRQLYDARVQYWRDFPHICETPPKRYYPNN